MTFNFYVPLTHMSLYHQMVLSANILNPMNNHCIVKIFWKNPMNNHGIEKISWLSRGILKNQLIIQRNFKKSADYSYDFSMFILGRDYPGSSSSWEKIPFGKNEWESLPRVRAVWAIRECWMQMNIHELFNIHVDCFYITTN